MLRVVKNIFCCTCHFDVGTGSQPQIYRHRKSAKNMYICRYCSNIKVIAINKTVNMFSKQNYIQVLTSLISVGNFLTEK